MCYILCESFNYKERVRSKRHQTILNYQTHEKNYIEDGNVVRGLLPPLERMFNCKQKIYCKVFPKKYFEIWKNLDKHLEVLM